ncbi:DUF2147 domain-containing protein [Paracoccus sp. DMF-8]|uniref:DUF2147 domain-containing protein n=1 Tax=Paracoccus sp. DMF-8 TaxID=3019445 RepID=UPI0023E7616C|nr:DUF2147 domain-containing protein [Paracoccus sp. DMF-8]MDF3605531.1 DUF2147 domain-containing protein [Paracoccus sp. DMF-8]
MKCTVLAAAFSLSAMLSGGAVMAQEISGIFQTQANDNGHVGMVEFYDCGGKSCGRLVKSFDGQGQEISSPHTGRNIVADMVSEGGGKFSGGTIWDPGADKTYRSKMELSGNRLNVSGCVAVFCRTQTWTKVR